jgi:hypothetical protein
VKPGDRPGVVLLVLPPRSWDDPTEVRYAVHRGGRVVMAGTAPSAEEADRLAFGSGGR